jgi:hypothetical protein
LSIPADLAARAAFLAKLHRESRLDKWVERIVRERVEIEESAFNAAKKNLASQRRPTLRPAPRETQIENPEEGALRKFRV